MDAAAQEPSMSPSRPDASGQASLVPEERAEDEEEDDREERHDQGPEDERCRQVSGVSACRPLILITDPSNQPMVQSSARSSLATSELDDAPFMRQQPARQALAKAGGRLSDDDQDSGAVGTDASRGEREEEQSSQDEGEQEEQYEEIDGISYRILAAVTKPPAERSARLGRSSSARSSHNQQKASASTPMGSFRRKSSAFVANLSNMLSTSKRLDDSSEHRAPRRMSIYEMTKSPPPETSLEMYLSERRRSSTVSSKHVQQQLQEQQTTFETNYCQRQQYFKDLNRILINRDNKLLNVVANRGQIHRHSVDIAQLPLGLAQAKANLLTTESVREKAERDELSEGQRQADPGEILPDPVNHGKQRDQQQQQHSSLRARDSANTLSSTFSRDLLPIGEDKSLMDRPHTSIGSPPSEHFKKPKTVVRKFRQFDHDQLISTPAPDVKIGQRIAFKEYYGSEFGTIRWIGRVPQISPDWTVGVEFDNAIGEGDGSLHGRRYFIAKDCFAKFLPLNQVTLVEQHVGRPEPGTMISVMAAAVRPGQMISIQRVSTVHVQHCFLNAPHHRPGADILAVNTRLHCQCPSCGPCAHVIKPPRTQRISHNPKNATHMCQFSTYTCCGMESQEEALCTYTGNKITASLPPPINSPSAGLPPVGNSWIDGSGYLASLQAQRSKQIPEEYKIGAAPEDIDNPELRRRLNKSFSTRRHHTDGRSKQRHRSSSRRGQSHAPMPLTRPPDELNDGAESLEEKKLALNVSDNQPSSSVRKPSDSFWDSETLSQLERRISSDGDLNLARKIAQSGPAQNLDATDEISEGSLNSPTIETHSLKSDGVFEPVSRTYSHDYQMESSYLFPNDEPIDSHLEADLENLSQARYGADTAINYRRSKPSKYIFRSLRSLVSCLNAPSNSELDDYSENLESFPARHDKQSFCRSLASDHGIECSENEVSNKVNSYDI